MMTTLVYKNIFLFFLGVKTSVVCVRWTDRDKDRPIAIFTHNFSWTYYTVLLQDPI